MGKIAGIITVTVALLVIIAIICGINSCDDKSNGTNEIGDFKEILKLSVLSIDYEDAYVIERNIGTNDNPIIRKLVYTVKAHGEYKYNLEYISEIIDSVSGKRTIVLPPSSLEMSLIDAPSLEYVQKDKSFINSQNVTEDEELKYRSQLKDSIENRLNNDIYKHEAFKHAEKLLKTFFKNMGDSTIVIKESEKKQTY